MSFHSRILTVRCVLVALLSFEIHLPCLLSLQITAILVISSRISEPLLKSIVSLTQKFLCRCENAAFVFNIRAPRMIRNRSVLTATNDATSHFLRTCSHIAYQI